MELQPVGTVESPLTDVATAPKQGDEGAPEAWLVFEERFSDALDGIAAGDDLLLLTWLHHADRSIVSVHPRDDPDRPLQGVFSTRSSDRPNPLGLHRVTVRAIEGLRVRVSALEAVNGTPIVDVKPALRDVRER